MHINHRKAAIVGCGYVGASIAFRFLQQGLFSQLVLLDANREKAEGEAMDLSDGLPYGAAMEITAGGYDDIADCALVVITAGANQKPGETRLDLIGRNTAIMQSILKEITARDFGGILLIVSNPVDVLTYEAWRLSGYPRERVIGSGTVLDTGRLKQLLGEELGVDSFSRRRRYRRSSSASRFWRERRWRWVFCCSRWSWRACWALVPTPADWVCRLARRWARLGLTVRSGARCTARAGEKSRRS